MNHVDRPAFVTFLTAGYPSPAETVESLLALERGGADVIELGKLLLICKRVWDAHGACIVGIPFTDPIADGPTIQYASTVSWTRSVFNAPMSNRVTHVVQCRLLSSTKPISKCAFKW